MDPSLLAQRFALRETQYLCERFEKSPNITEACSVADNLGICYGMSDASIIPALGTLLRRVYLFVKEWFGYRGDVAIDLWVAPTIADLQYMTCVPHEEGYACAPGTRNGANIIILDSPLSGGKNSDNDRLAAVLAHEITHHFVAEISRSTPFTMKRREGLDVPMWLEEGLGMVVMTEMGPSFGTRFNARIVGITDWYPLDDMWNDLADCEDADRAYLQAYREAKRLVEQRGRVEVIRLLYLNRTHYINWNDLPCGGDVLARAKPFH